MKNLQRNRVDTVFVLMIFCVFAFSVFLVLMLSASTYSNMTERSQRGQNERIALSYVRTKVRNADSAGAVTLAYFNGVPALSLTEDFDGVVFLTYIYHYDGHLRELFFRQGDEFTPGDGVPIIRSGELNFSKSAEGLLSVNTDYGSLLLFPRSAEHHLNTTEHHLRTTEVMP